MWQILIEGMGREHWVLRGLLGAVVGAFLFIWVPTLFQSKEGGPQIKAGDGGNASVRGGGTAIGGAGGSIVSPPKGDE